MRRDVAVRGIAFVGGEPRIVDEQRRAIRTKNLAVLSHIEIDMGVIERRTCAHALQFLHADENLLGTNIIGQMGNGGSSHSSSVLARFDLPQAIA